MKYLKKIRLEHILLILSIILYIVYAYSVYKTYFVESPKFAAMEYIDSQSREWLNHVRRWKLMDIYDRLFKAVTTISIFVMIVRKKTFLLILYFSISLLIAWTFSIFNGNAFIGNFYLPLTTSFIIKKYLYCNIAALVLAIIVRVGRSHVISSRKQSN